MRGRLFIRLLVGMTGLALVATACGGTESGTDTYRTISLSNDSDRPVTVGITCPAPGRCNYERVLGGLESTGINVRGFGSDGAIDLTWEYEGCEATSERVHLPEGGAARTFTACAAPTPATTTTTPPAAPEWLVAALAELEETSGTDPEWVGSTFWGSATWSELDDAGAPVTYVDQPFTLAIGESSAVDRPWRCTTYADKVVERDPLDDLTVLLDNLQASARAGSFGAVLDTVVDGPGPFYPQFVPAECTLDLPMPSGYAEGENPIVISANRIDAGFTEDWPEGGALLPISLTGMPEFCRPGSEIRLEKVGSIAETGGSVIRGTWLEWDDCSRGQHRDPDHPSPSRPVDGARCVTNVLRWDVEFISTKASDHERFLRSEQEIYTGETITPLDHETFTSCLLTTKGTFYAFSFPPDEAGLPGGITAAQVRRVLQASGLARSGAVPEDAAEKGFFEVVAEIRKEALTWILRNMPVYDTADGTWSSFESYAIAFGRQTGVPPDSRLAQDPVGTAMDMVFGDATVDDMVGWIGFGNG